MLLRAAQRLGGSGLRLGSSGALAALTPACPRKFQSQVCVPHARVRGSGAGGTQTNSRLAPRAPMRRFATSGRSLELVDRRDDNPIVCVTALARRCEVRRLRRGSPQRLVNGWESVTDGLQPLSVLQQLTRLRGPFSNARIRKLYLRSGLAVTWWLTCLGASDNLDAS